MDKIKNGFFLYYFAPKMRSRDELANLERFVDAYLPTKATNVRTNNNLHILRRQLGTETMMFVPL